MAEGRLEFRDQAAHDSSDAGELALAWIEHDLMPRLIVADNLAIAWSNVAARSLLAARRDVEERAGIFTTVDRSLQAPLLRFVTASEVAVSSWAFPRSDGDGHMLFRAQRIDWRGDGMFGIAFYGSGSEFQARYADLDKVFGLTGAEHRVLLDMLEGFKADHLSEIHSVSIETIRTHIRNIYAKLQVRSREELFHRLRPYRI
ncbi:MAG: helix-turn-helix transcriptional regulator [Allosphingosinicella sp.]